jgi:hypothetical protein
MKVLLPQLVGRGPDRAKMIKVGRTVDSETGWVRRLAVSPHRIQYRVEHGLPLTEPAHSSWSVSGAEEAQEAIAS